MYFSVSSDFANFPDELRARSAAISNLISGMRAGYHHLIMERGLVDCAVVNCDLSERERQLLIAHVRPRYTIGASEMKATGAYVECVRAGIMPNLPANALAVELRHFDEPRHIAPTRLIVEDLIRDRAGIEMLLAVYLRFFQRGGRTLFEFVHGGGSMTSAAFRQAFTEPRPVICSVDSDRRAPNAPLGNTAQAVLEAEDEAPFPTARVAVLPVRELENAIPIRATRIVYGEAGAHDVTATCQMLIDFCESSAAKQERRAQMVAFLDLKEGLNAGDVLALFEEFSAELIDLWRHVNGAQACPEAGEVNEFLLQNPFNGIAHNLLQVVSETFLIKPHILKDIARNFRKLPFHTELLEHAKLISDFGSAPVPIPVRI